MLIRKAKMTDVEALHSLFNYYADKGLMLARSRSALYESLREFTVVQIEDKVVGAGGLHIIWEDLAEVRALAIAEEYAHQGIGRQVVQALLQEAHELELKTVFSLTYQAGFFQKCGFKIVDKDTLPHKVWKECINCPKFPNCDETAVIMELK